MNRPDLPIIGGKDCQSVDRTPADREGFQIGKAISVTGLYTPCHTQDSICWFMQEGDKRVVFTGDTLFHGGTLVSFSPLVTERRLTRQDAAASLRAPPTR